ncbi:WD40-repeat-containing domain protein [Flagelloscypha sp. PMI_526]|nr:WD40-repeat-containing domain protein [Flagelloscypha sp. PMI_526]
MSGDQEKSIVSLSLDGGRWENLGVLTQIHVVEDILHKYEIDKGLDKGSARVSDVFDLVVGTGIGGLVACMLGPLRLSTKDAKDIVLRLRDLHVWSKVPISDRMGVLKNELKSLLDSQTGNGENPLSETQLSDFGKRTPPCKFAVTVMAASNITKPVMLRGYRGRSSPIQCTLLEALLATLSDARVFPPVLIGNTLPEPFFATTTGHCNPTEALILELPSLFKARGISVIVSVGSGCPGPAPLAGPEDFDRDVLDQAKSCHAVSESIAFQFSRYPGLFVRLDVDGFDLSATLQPEEMISHTRTYLNKQAIRDRLDSLSSSLKDRLKRLEVDQLLSREAEAIERIGRAVDDVRDMVPNLLQESRHGFDILGHLTTSRDAPFSSANTGSIRRQSCTPGTRTSILRSLLVWAKSRDPETSSALACLHGRAGTGKTTILYDICESLQAEENLASSYFCSRQLSSGNSYHIVPNIARDLASCLPVFKDALVSQLRGNSYLFSAKMKLQFEDLLCIPWNAVVKARDQDSYLAKVVVIDALDECDGRDEFLDLLLEAIKHGRFSGLRFIISCRPIANILTKVRTLQSDALCVSLHDVPGPEIDGDIQSYFRANLKLALPKINELVARANGLFIYASTVVKYLTSSQSLTPRELERRLGKVFSKIGYRDSLDALYAQIVNDAFQLDDDDDMKERWAIIHAIVCAAVPPSPVVVSGLLGVNLALVNLVVESLSSVVFTVGMGGPISIAHASFRDFIISDISFAFRCHPLSVHLILAQACLTEMQNSLRFNICHLESSFTPDSELKPPLNQRVVEHIGDYLAYASQNWWFHIKQSGVAVGRIEVLLQIEPFLREKGIFWIEVMSLLGELRTCKHILRELTLPFSERPLLLRNIPSLAWEYANLVTLFQTIPTKITSHIYLTCLALADTTALIERWRSQFLYLPQVVSRLRSGRSYCQMVLEMGGPIVSAALSANGRYLVSSITDTTVYIWDIESGKIFQQLYGHTSSVCSVAISHDGRQVVSGSMDNTIRIWYIEPGKKSLKLEGHTAAVHSVAFSLDDTFLASGSDDKTIRIWNVEAGKVIRQLNGHTSSVCSVALFFKRYLVSGSADNTVRIWDIDSGTEYRKLEGHTSWVFSVAVSPNGKRIVSGSKDKTIRIWDVKSGKKLRVIGGHTFWVHSVAFSPDGQRVLSGSADTTACIWDADSGKKLVQLEGHADSVVSAAFSSDGGSVISASRDRTARIWNANLSIKFSQSHDHAKVIYSVTFSPDGTHIASAADDTTIRIWDTASGVEIRRLKGHSGGVLAVSFSPDGKRIVSGSYDSSIGMWDAQSGKKLRWIRGHAEAVSSVGFALKGTRIVSASHDNTVCVWDPLSGRKIRQLESQTEVISVAAFSANRVCVLWDAKNQTASTWDVETGIQLRVLEPRISEVRAVAISLDEKYIACGFDDNAMSIWDASSGKVTRQLVGHTDHVLTVTFSSNGRHIVSGSADNTVCLWDTDSGQKLGQLTGHTDSVCSVAFSPDGRRVASCSADKTICLRNAEFCQKFQLSVRDADFLRSVTFSAHEKRVVCAGNMVSAEDIMEKIGHH